MVLYSQQLRWTESSDENKYLFLDLQCPITKKTSKVLNVLKRLGDLSQSKVQRTVGCLLLRRVMTEARPICASNRFEIKTTFSAVVRVFSRVVALLIVTKVQTLAPIDAIY